jgi:membrane-bound lytic murein transglycosylase D
MRKSLILPTLLGLAACARAGGGPMPSPVTSVAPLPAPPAAAAPPGAPALRADSGRAPTTPRQATPSFPTPTARSTVHDTSSDAAFLDTLRFLSADSAIAARQAAPGGAGREETTRLAAGPPPASAPAYDIEVAAYASNDRVRYYLDYFAGRARGHFQIYLARLGRYDALLRSRLQAAHLPQDLVYMALIESGMNPNAVSRRRAVGLWQFIAGTGKRYGLTVDPWVDERRDPWRATEAAIRMISELNDQFGSLYLAAAAYDAGPGKIQRGLNRYDLGGRAGNDRFFALADERFLRRETRDYVPKIIAAAIIAKEPEKWGFGPIEPWRPLRFDSVRVADAVGLDVLARLADTSQEAMEELNPQLVRRVTPPGRTVWVRVPPGRSDSMAARLAVLPPDRRVSHFDHDVSRGETLGAIASKYHVSVDDILGANRGVRPRSLSVGQRLVIPTPGLRPAVRPAYAEAATHGRAAGPRLVAAGRAARPAPSRYLLSTAARLPNTGTRRVHIVRSGESVWIISRQFQVPLEGLLRENGLTRRSLIKPGQALRIPS